MSYVCAIILKVVHRWNKGPVYNFYVMYDILGVNIYIIVKSL